MGASHPTIGFIPHPFLQSEKASVNKGSLFINNVRSETRFFVRV